MYIAPLYKRRIVSAALFPPTISIDNISGADIIAYVPDPAQPDPESLLPLPSATFHILMALAAGDRHGYAIIQEVARRTNNRLRLGPATLYRSLQRMLEQGLIIETADRPNPERDDERRRYYRITRFGESVARAEARRLAELLKLARASGFAGGRT